MQLQWSNAWGYHSDVTLSQYSEQGKMALEATHVMNAFGYLLSPIIGIVRLFANAHFLFYSHKDVNKSYAAAQIVRGTLELLCLGIFLSVIDLAVTCQRKTPVASYS